MTRGVRVLYSLYEVDHAGLSVSHLPVEGQGLQAVIAREGAPGAEVHGAAGLGVAGHRFPPVCPLFVLCEEKGWRWKDGGVRDQRGRKKNKKKQGVNRADKVESRAAGSPLPSCFSPAAGESEGGLMSLTGFACERTCARACVCSPEGCFSFACAHSVNAYANVYVYIPSLGGGGERDDGGRDSLKKGPFEPRGGS